MSVRPYKKNGEIIANAWVIDYLPDGKKGRRVQKTIFDVTESAARLLESDLRRQARARRGQRITPELADKPIFAILPEWLRWLKIHRAEETLKSIGWALKHLQPHFGNLTIDQLSEETFNQYKLKRMATPRACNLEMDYIKSFVSWCAARGICKPLDFKVERLKYKRPLPKIPTPADLNKWLDEIKDPQKRAMVDFMLYAGLRFKEVSRLEWSNVNLSSRLATLVDTKGERPRNAVVPESVAAFLETIPKKDRRGLVFPSPKAAKDGSTGNPYNNMKSVFRGASERSGVHIKGPHTLRHICGTYTLAGTGNLRLVQTTLGHTTSRTTELYTQIELTGQKQGQAAVADLMAANPFAPGANEKDENDQEN